MPVFLCICMYLRVDECHERLALYPIGGVQNFPLLFHLKRISPTPHPLLPTSYIWHTNVIFNCASLPSFLISFRCRKVEASFLPWILFGCPALAASLYIRARTARQWILAPHSGLRHELRYAAVCNMGDGDRYLDGWCRCIEGLGDITVVNVPVRVRELFFSSPSLLILFCS